MNVHVGGEKTDFFGTYTMTRKPDFPPFCCCISTSPHPPPHLLSFYGIFPVFLAKAAAAQVMVHETVAVSSLFNHMASYHNTMLPSHAPHSVAFLHAHWWSCSHCMSFLIVHIEVRAASINAAGMGGVRLLAFMVLWLQLGHALSCIAFGAFPAAFLPLPSQRA